MNNMSKNKNQGSNASLENQVMLDESVFKKLLNRIGTNVFFGYLAGQKYNTSKFSILLRECYNEFSHQLCFLREIELG
jgi:hypothetical protein